MAVTDPATSLAQAPVATSSSSKHCYDWLEPPDTEGGVFATFPEVKTWCQKNLWIPSDGRIRLVFDIPSIDTSKPPKRAAAATIYSSLQDVSNKLVKNQGRLLIVDNDCYGSRLFGNLTRTNDQRHWSTKITNSSIRELIPLKVPMIDSRQSYQWRRLM